MRTLRVGYLIPKKGLTMASTEQVPTAKAKPGPCFDSLIEDSLNRLPSARTSPDGPPSDFQRVEKQQKRGSTVFDANFQRLDEVGDFRSVYIASPVVEIVNLFFFPDPDVPGSVFAMEFVRIGPRGVVGVIDCKAAAGDPSNEEAATLLQTAHRTFPHLQNGDDSPAWYREARSGNDFFVRPDNLEVFDVLVDAHHFVWGHYIESILKMSRDPSGKERRAPFLRHYKDHHRDNSPGIPFLNKVFGREWTETLLRDHLFA